MVYEKPEAKILCFAPVENIAADWQWDLEVEGGGSDGGSGSEFDITLPGSNPEGDA